ncbi:MAG: hypothetical protein RLZZ502_1921 [Pseudomonadota bacterium]|jgi:soluble lytic murein transglycosylase-like protein
MPVIKRLIFILATVLAAAAPLCVAQWPVQDLGIRHVQLIRSAQAYEHGEGVPKDQSKAYEIYCQVAREGHAEAQYKLAWMIANGRGVPRSQSSAAAVFALAAEQGHEGAKKLRDFMGKPSEYLPLCLQGAEWNDPVANVLALNLSVGFMHAMNPKGEYQAIDWLKNAGWRKSIIDTVRVLAPSYQIDPDLALSIIAVESAFDVNAKSEKNAQGLMQLIPDTAKRFNVKDILSPHDNIRGGLAYLQWLMNAFRGQVVLVAAAYNAGEQAVVQHAGIPPYAETRAYVTKLCRLYPKRVHVFDAKTKPLSLLDASEQSKSSGCVLEKDR